jgi:hypothetical protein
LSVELRLTEAIESQEWFSLQVKLL